MWRLWSFVGKGQFVGRWYKHVHISILMLDHLESGNYLTCAFLWDRSLSRVSDYFIITYLIAGWTRHSMSIHFTFLVSRSARRAHQAEARDVLKNLRRSAGRWLARFPKRVEKVNRKECTAHQYNAMMASKRIVIECISFIKHRNAARIRRKAHRCLHRRRVITEIT